jgi:hypothetical protein
VLAGPLHIVPLGTIFCIGAQIYYRVIIGGQMGISVGNQFIPFHSQVVPALAGRHAALASDASDRVNQLAVSPGIGTCYFDRSKGRGNGGTGQKFQETTSIDFYRWFCHLPIFVFSNFAAPASSRIFTKEKSKTS